MARADDSQFEASRVEVPRVEALMQIELAWSPRAGEVQRRMLTLPQGATIADALGKALADADEGVHVLMRSAPGLAPELAPAVWGRVRETSHPLRDGDRLELLRPLAADPMEARRRRHRGARQVKK